MTSWILEFDAGCRSCSDVVDRVRAAARDDKLTMAALTEPHVREWRQRALGASAPWAPTLIAVDADDVRAWTGTALSIRLVRLLGVADSMRVVRALNHADIVRHPGRRKVLKAVPLLGLGAFVLSGGLAAPAMAATGSGRGRAATWVRANMDRLPTAYGDFGTYPMAYGRAIFNALSPNARANLWAAHFEHYRKTHPALTPAQATVIDDAARLAPRVITTGRGREALQALATTAATAFGADEARALLSTLGPLESPQPIPTTAAPRVIDGTRSAEWWCEDVGPECNTNCEAVTGCNDLCWGPCVCSSSGCGDLWLMECNGLCGD